ncbi:MAG: GNAT family N-acetyltransferase [Saprospiraceae bacterium]
MDFLLQTSRLNLRPLTMSDFDYYYAVQGNAELMRYIRKPETDPGIVRERIEFFEKYAAENPGLGAFVAEWKAGGEGPVASCVLRHAEYHPENDFELGYLVQRAHWGQGLASEIVTALVSYAFEHFGVPKVTAFADPDNHASHRVLEKCGFRHTGPRFIYDSDNFVFELENPAR